jgi:predicted transcriptional regulator
VNEIGNILISIKRKFVLEMLSGNKTVELRRRRLHVASGTRVWIYSTAPHCAVELHATVDYVDCASPDQLWRRYRWCVGISRVEFDRYFLRAKTGCAVILRDLKPLSRAVELSHIRRSAKFHPPQFFKRLGPDSAALRAITANLEDQPQQFLVS